MGQNTKGHVGRGLEGKSDCDHSSILPPTIKLGKNYMTHEDLEN